MDEQQNEVRHLIGQMLEASGLDLSGLARRAGVAPSTLTRFMNKPVKHTLSAKTLQKLSKASGVPVAIGSDYDTGQRAALLAAYDAMGERARRALVSIAEELARAERDGSHPSPARGGDGHAKAPGRVVPLATPLRVGERK